MVQARIMNHHGYVPWLLWVGACPDGLGRAAGGGCVDASVSAGESAYGSGDGGVVLG
jgi:hypothetical protein